MSIYANLLSKLVPGFQRGFCENGTMDPTKAKENVSCEIGSGKFFAISGLGGVLSCGITHTILVPLDLVKCRIQTNASKYPNIGTGFRVTMQEEGIRALGKGWAPTMIGYSVQGFGKFGLYEAFN